MERQRIVIGGMLTYPEVWLYGVVTSPDRPGVAAAVFGTLGERGVNVQLIVQGVDLQGNAQVQFCVAESDRETVSGILQDVMGRVAVTRMSTGCPAYVVCIYGPDFQTRPGIAGRVFESLADASINILAISTSISTVSCVVAREDGRAAVEALREAFVLP